MDQKEKTVPVQVIGVQSPNKLIVRNILDNLGEQHLATLEHIILRSFPGRRGRQNRNLDNNVVVALEIGTHIAAVSDEFEGARRGKIIDINREEEPLLNYGVFLYDYGLFRIYERCSIVPLRSDYQKDLAHCARRVMIPGLIPAAYIPGGTRGVPAEEWSDESIEFVNEWIKGKSIHLLELATIDDVSICGDFYAEGQSKSLSRRLIDKRPRLAIYDEIEYNKLMGTTENPSPVDSVKGQGENNEKDEAAHLDVSIPVSGIKAKFAKLRVAEDENDFSLPPEEIGYNKNETTIPTLPVKVLLRGNDLLPPYNNLECFPLHELIAKTLEFDMKILQINHLQRSSWPHVLRGRNCFIIGGQSKKKGKSLSYIVPIAAACLSELEVSNKPGQYATNGPLGLFICSSLHSGEKLKEHMDKLLGRSKIGIYLATAVSGGLKSKLRENPEFIITTPEFVHTLLDDYYALFGFDRLRYLVFDDAHVLMKYKLERVTTLIQRISHYLEKIEKRPFSLQTIFCGEEWNQEMESAFLNLTTEPVLIIGSSFQAIAYGNIKVQVYFVEVNEKLDRLTELIGNKIQTRAVILCQTQETVVHVGHSLYRNKGIKTVYLPIGDITSSEINYMRNDWLNSRLEDRILFICMDSDLMLLRLEEVRTIIHYDMPLGKLETFGDRHVCMWNLFPDISKAQSTNSLPETELMSHVFLTPVEPDLHKIVRHFRKIQVQIPEDLNIFTQIDEKFTSLCKSIMQFGKCDKSDKQDCERRHFLNLDELNEESIVPRVGRIEIEIIQCVTVNTFKGKLQHYYKVVNGRKLDCISFLNILKKREDDLTQYYSEESNRIPLPNPNKKSICGFLSNEGNYTRGRIEIVLKTSVFEFPLEVRVFCVDTGQHAVRPVSELYTLPQEFVSLQPMCVNVILADLKPVNAEEQFKLEDNMKARRLTEGGIYTAKIVFSIGNTILVKPMVEYEKNLSGDLVQRKDIRNELTKELRVAEDNPNHLVHLYQMAELIGFDCDVYMTPEVIGRDFEETYYVSGETISWAYLQTSSMNNPKTVEVYSTFFQSPDYVYVTLDKFVDLLDDVNEELHDHVLTQIEGQYSDYALRFQDYYEERMCVAAKERDDNVWNRAIIIKIREDIDDGKKLFDVFFVDHGDSVFGLKACELFPIPKKFVNRLPFQAIGLKINHVRRNDGAPEWNDKVEKVLNDCLFIEGKIKKSKCVDIMAVNKLEKLNWNEPPCHYYEAFVFIEDKELGEILVEKNYAKYCTTGIEGSLKRLKKKILAPLNKIVDSHLINNGSSDDAVVPGFLNYDDFDVCLGKEDAEGMLNTLLPNMVRKNAAAAAALPGGHDEPRPSSSKALRAELADKSTAGKSASSSSPASVGMPKENISGNSESTEYTRKPHVLWTQTKTTVTLQIEIPDLMKYTFQIGDDKSSISFQSEDPPPKNYSFKLELLHKVLSPPQFSLLGPHLLVKLTKLSPGTKWTRVTRDEIKMWWLKRDFSTLESDDSDNYISDNDVEIGEGYETQNGTQAYKTMPVSYERDDEDSYSSDSDICDGDGQDAD